MNRTTWISAAVLIAVAAAVLVATSDGDETDAEIPTSFTGVITDIESSGLNEVSSFEVRHDGTTTTVYIRDAFDYGFPIGHLQAHLTSGDPVTVTGEVIDDKLYADSIEDA